MWPPSVVPLEVVSKPYAKLVVVFGSSFHPEEKLLFIGAERSFNERILIGATFVDTMMRELQLRTQGLKSSLKLKAIVCLDEDGFEGKFGQHHDEGTDTSILVQLIEDHCFLVAGVDINESILVTGPDKPRELRGYVFDIHLEVSNGRNILCMHMNRWLVPGSDVIPISVYQPSPFQYAMNRGTRS